MKSFEKCRIRYGRVGIIIGARRQRKRCRKSTAGDVILWRYTTAACRVCQEYYIDASVGSFVIAFVYTHTTVTTGSRDRIGGNDCRLRGDTMYGIDRLFTGADGKNYRKNNGYSDSTAAVGASLKSLLLITGWRLTAGLVGTAGAAGPPVMGLICGGKSRKSGWDRQMISNELEGEIVDGGMKSANILRIIYKKRGRIKSRKQN